MRRDGNCFYRAFLFQLFEYYALNIHSSKEAQVSFSDLCNIVKNSKEDLIKEGGYQEVVIQDFHLVFMRELDKLKQIHTEYQSSKDRVEFKSFVEKHLFSILCNHQEASYLIMYTRFMTATYIKKNYTNFEDFVGHDIEEFCSTQVEPLDIECDHPQIIALTSYL